MNAIRRYLSLGVALGVVLFAPSSAAAEDAASGEFTRTEASADWTLASVAGSITWNYCEFPPGWNVSTTCSWLPYVTVGPGTDAADCSSASRRWEELGDGISVAWSGSESGKPGWAAFDLTEIPLSGKPGQLVCLSVVEDVWESCVGSGAGCLMMLGNFTTRFRTLDAASLAAPSEPPSPVENAAAGGPDADSALMPPGPLLSNEQPKIRRCPKGKRLVKARGGKRVCRHRLRRHSRVSPN